MRILGIDPGVSGAVALIENGKLVFVDDMPTVEVAVGKSKRKRIVAQMVDSLLLKLNPDLIVLEQVSTRPGEGAVGAFSFGRGLGILEGVIASRKFSCQWVMPAVWKRNLDVPADKDAARLKAIALFPHMAKEFARKKDDGRAEACLIALYGLRKHGMA